MVLFAKVFLGPLLLLTVSTLARTGVLPFDCFRRFLGSKPPVAVVPPRCPTFGEGGRSFFQAANYAEFVRCHNAHYFATNHRPRPIHVLFEASAKTELGTAFGLMKALAAQPEKYQVTYLSPGGTIVRRTPSTESGPWPKGLVLLGPGEKPDERDTTLYEFALPSEKNLAGVTVVSFSAFGGLGLSLFSMVKRFVKDGFGYSESATPGSDRVMQEEEKFSGERIWIQTLRSQNLSPVDFVVTDCLGPRSVELLRAGAQVPGLSWCGNFLSIPTGLKSIIDGGLWSMIDKQLRAKKPKDSHLFRNAELTPIFSAHFLGWGAEAKQPFPRFFSEATGRVGLTRPFRRNEGLPPDFTGPLVDYRMKVPISLVSDLPTATEIVPRPSTELPAITAIDAKMTELNATRLIYIAFGSQGFRFKKEAYKEIIEAAAAVTDAVVFFVIPPAADWEHGPAYPYIPDTWKTKYYEVSVAGEARLTLPKNVLLSTWAPQKAIFERFGGRNTVFLTHGGAGSLSQGIANKIALACFGFRGDQPENCAKAARKGLGVDLGRFSQEMLFDDKPTIEMYGGADMEQLQSDLMPDKRSFEGDATPEAGGTIQERIEFVFKHATEFQAALARALDGLKVGAHAQDAVIGAFEQSMRKQLELYKALSLFDAGRQLATRRGWFWWPGRQLATRLVLVQDAQ